MFDKFFSKPVAPAPLAAPAPVPQKVSTVDQLLFKEIANLNKEELEQHGRSLEKLQHAVKGARVAVLERVAFLSKIGAN